MEPMFWHWLIGGVILIAAEALVPGTYLLWPGIAAFATGIVSYSAPGLGWEIHTAIFAALTVIAALAGRGLYARYKEPPSAAPLLNKRVQQLVGTVHTLETPILDGAGRLKLGDSVWKIIGPDMPVGARIKIIGADGSALRVDAADA